MHLNVLNMHRHLSNTANEIDKLNGPCLAYLKQLNGDGNNIGLIQQAKNMMHQQ